MDESTAVKQAQTAKYLVCNRAHCLPGHWRALNEALQILAAPFKSKPLAAVLRRAVGEEAEQVGMRPEPGVGVELVVPGEPERPLVDRPRGLEQLDRGRLFKLEIVCLIQARVSTSSNRAVGQSESHVQYHWLALRHTHERSHLARVRCMTLRAPLWFIRHRAIARLTS